jgi:hypothetical protein
MSLSKTTLDLFGLIEIFIYLYHLIVEMIIDELQVGTYYSSVEDEKNNKFEIKEEDIPSLISLLSAGGISIDKDNSEKNIEYTVNKKTEEAKVPLHFTFDKNVKLTSFTLRGEGLEIKAEYPYFSTRGASRSLCGTVYLGERIIFKLLYYGDDSKGILIIDNAKKFINSFYKTKEVINADRN